MRKSDLDRKVYAGPRRVCRYETIRGEKCRERATVSLTVTSYLSNPDRTLSATGLLCGKHADKTVGTYETEWAKHPEQFE